MSVRFLLSGIALVGLTACGGGGGGGGGTTVPPSNLGDMTGSYGELANEFPNIQIYFDAGLPSSLPGGNNVEYGGSMLIAEDLYNGNSTYINGTTLIDTQAGVSSSGYIGEVLLTANFGGGSVTGSVDNFFATDINAANGPNGSNGALSGSSLTLSNGTINGTNTFDMDVSGSIDSMTADGELIVRFFGPGGQFVLAESVLDNGLTLDGDHFDVRMGARQR